MATTNLTTADHIIVGGGVIGLLTAYYLSQELGKDSTKVVLVERGEIGKESSWAGGGILSPLYPWRYPDAVTQLVQWSQAQYPGLCQQLTDTTGIDPQWTHSGLLILDQTEITTAQTWAQTHKLTLQTVSSHDLYEIEPKLSHAFDQGLWLPDVAQVRNPRLVKALQHYLQQRGVTLMDHTELTDILTEGQTVRGIRTERGDLASPSVIIACGAWSAPFLQPLGLTLDVHPVRGQMILLQTEPDLVQRMVMNEGRYVIPRRDGSVLVGSTLEHVEFDKRTTASAKETLQQAAVQLIPALRDYEVALQWAGLRPGSSDDIPTIAEHPNLKGLFINAGHYRNGVVTAPASARLMANMVLQQTPIINPNQYRVIRQQPM